MSDWITDRLPTRDDADYEGTVWITRDEMVERTVFLNVMLRRAWMPIDEPPPYQPPAPEPDTSLEASIEFVASMSKTGLTEVERGHVERVIAAAQVYAASREGIDDDPSPERVDELIRLCGIMQFIPECEYELHHGKIKQQLAKRGER